MQSWLAGCVNICVGVLMDCKTSGVKPRAERPSCCVRGSAPRGCGDGRGLWWWPHCCAAPA
eukprot:213604-Chlamydomonas_euryale.AAC.46